MRGIILAGGMGTRLRPLTYVANKHLLPVYDKPMIIYPLETLKSLGIKDIMIISGGEHIGSFTEYLGNGSKFGVDITYRVQEEAGGIAHALALAEDYVDGQFAVILGDNIFGGHIEAPAGCGIVLKEVEHSNRFGVYHEGKIIEKPKTFISNMAVTGLYFYTPEVFDFISTLKPSARGEMEITDVNNWCLENLNMTFAIHNGFWSDAGTFDSLLSSANWVKDTEGGLKAEDVLRSNETWEEYGKVFNLKKEKMAAGMLECELIEEFSYWKVVKNTYPYDKVTALHYLLIPKREFANFSDMTSYEAGELEDIKRHVTEKYRIDVIAENTDIRRSVKNWFHLHLIKWKSVR